jgi:predicted Zn-dependent protease
MRIFPVQIAMLALLLIWNSVCSGEAKKVTSVTEEQREIDQLIAFADSVELGKISPRIFELAGRLLKEKGDAQARPYFEKGLQGNSWALEHQLTLGEILNRSGQPAALREKAEMVLRIGEDDEVLKRASHLAGRPLPEDPKPLPANANPEKTLVLVPTGGGSMFLLQDLRDILSKRLGIKVIIASMEMEIPKPDRTAKTQWISRTRERVVAITKENPAAAVQLGRMGYTLEQLQKDDQALITMIRATTTVEQGASAVEALDKELALLEQTKQWDADKFLRIVCLAVGPKVTDKRLFLAVTPHDLFAGKSNYLFGTAATGWFVGLVSTNRFRAAFNGEPPRRERLKERLLKQSLSTFGHMLGVPRCTTPDCARAYPQSLAEHDTKPSTLCTACRAGIESALGQKLPPE